MPVKQIKGKKKAISTYSVFIVKSPSKLGQKRHTPVEFSHLSYCDITWNNLGLCPRLLSISLFWSIAPHPWMFGNEKHLYVQQKNDWQRRSQTVNRCGGSNGNTPHRLLDPRWWCCLGKQRRCGLAGGCMSLDRGSGSLKTHAISSLFSLLCVCCAGYDLSASAPGAMPACCQASPPWWRWTPGRPDYPFLL